MTSFIQHIFMEYFYYDGCFVGNQDISGRIVFSGALMLGGKKRNVNIIMMMSERKTKVSKVRIEK